MKAKLYNILNELNQYKHSKNELRQFYINERLSKSLETYYKTLTQSVNFLQDAKITSVMKQLNNK